MGNIKEALEGKCRFCGSTNLKQYEAIEDAKCEDCLNWQNEEESLLSRVEKGDKEASADWVKKAKSGKVMRIM